MSDTPKTDAKAIFFGWNPEEGEEFVQADFARELERENAALLRHNANLVNVLEALAKGKDVPGVTVAEIAEYAQSAVNAVRKEKP